MCRFLLFILMVLPLSGNTQELASDEMGFVRGIASSIASAVKDVDRDGFDELVYIQDGKYLSISRYNGKQSAYEVVARDTNELQLAWSVVAGNVDEDEMDEIIVASGFGIFQYDITQIDGTYSLSLSKIFDNTWLPQSSNLTDIDGDGQLEYFVCNDHGNSVLLMREDGVWGDVSDRLFDESQDKQNSGNYSSIWTDIDNDGDLDLYIGKCQAGVNSAKDSRRINQLYINDGNGDFQEMAAIYGLADGNQTWSVDAADVDNDQDIDLFITNHTGLNTLYINEVDTFVPFDFEGLMPRSFSFQGELKDVDNNGWKDVVLTGDRKNFVFYNDQMNFRREQWTSSNPRSVQLVDVDANGTLDMWCQYLSSDLTVPADADGLLLNQSTHNFLSLTDTRGDLSRPGVRIVVYTDGLNQMQEMRHGSSFGHQSTGQVLFGLESRTSVDSVQVYWADGSLLSIDGSDVAINTINVITKESGCVKPMEQPTADNIIACPKVLTNTIYSQHGNAVIWDQGMEAISYTDSTRVGSYRYAYEADGCHIISDVLNVVAPDTIDKILEQDRFALFCRNEGVELSSAGGYNPIWSTGEDTSRITVYESGAYSVIVSDVCGDLHTDFIKVKAVDGPESLHVDGVKVKSGERATLQSQEESTTWYKDGEAVGYGTNYTTDPLAESTDYEVDWSTAKYHGLDIAGAKWTETDTVSRQGGNDGLLFETKDRVVLRSVNAYALVSGERNIQIYRGPVTDGWGIYSKSVMMQEGLTVVPLDLELLEPGQYTITTSVDQNMLSFGSKDPKLSYAAQEASFPMELEGDFAIVGSIKDSVGYPYFFDWVVEHHYAECLSEKVTVTVEVETVHTSDEKAEDLRVYPNPNNGAFTVSSEEMIEKIYLRSAAGITFEALSVNAKRYEVNRNLSPGMYLLEINLANGKRRVEKMVVTK